jgi:hypothetical protein
MRRASNRILESAEKTFSRMTSVAFCQCGAASRLTRSLILHPSGCTCSSIVWTYRCSSYPKAASFPLRSNADHLIVFVIDNNLGAVL